jgi:hypothetical protein
VKIPLTEFQRLTIVPIAGLVLAAYYLVVLLPLSRRAEGLDDPVNRAWKKLSLSLDQTNTSTIDFLHITNQLSETRQALLTLDNAKKDATARLQLDPALRLKIHSDFVLVQYENERSQQRETLANLAKQAKVDIDPTVLTSYPEYTFDVLQPNYLWAALSFSDSLVRTAVGCKVSAIQALDVPPVLTNRPSTSSAERLVEIPVQLEFTGSATNADKFLQCLPLRAEEARAAGLTNTPADKPVLFIDRLVVQKQSPDKVDEVHVWLRVVGFVLRE